MALPPDSVFRGVAAAIDQPASEEDAVNQLSPYIAGITLYNTDGEQFLYRNPHNDQDIIEAVYRWDDRDYQEIFRTGFRPRPRGATTEADYYNLLQHVNNGGMPADQTPADGSVFVSTTRSTTWKPPVTTDMILYRYQIYAPGGIDTVQTLGNRHHYQNQQEIAFAGGISPQYIRIARAYAVVVDPAKRYPSYVRLGNNLYGNYGFNPNPDLDGWTPMRFHYRLRNPTCPGRGDVLIWYPESRKRSIRENDQNAVCGVGHYIESAFNFSNKEWAYLFVADRCLLIYYAPATTNDRIIKGLQSIGDAFPCLKDTIFASGIDAAFTASSKNEAYIFRSNIYALINFEADGGYIIQGPKKITDSFYSLKNTIFENGIDVAFNSSTKDEAYIFKADQYALINFAPGTTDDYIIYGPKKTTLSFNSFKGTIFEDGFDAAFSSTRTNEAYIFKGNTYALINYAPRSTNDYIINGPISPISDGFNSLKGILPVYPCGC